jgi:hypothetical protein
LVVIRRIIAAYVVEGARVERPAILLSPKRVSWG